MRRDFVDRREGFALGVVVLALLVLAGIASAAVAAAVGQVRSAVAAGELLAARASARAELEAAFAGTTGATAALAGGPAVELASGASDDGVAWRVLDLRITAEHHLLVGEATTGRGVSFRELRPAWWMDPETRVADHRAVLEGAEAQVAAGARVLADRLLGARPGVEACASRKVLADAFAGRAVPLAGPLPRASAQEEPGGTPGDSVDGGEVGLGLLRGAMLRRAADLRLPLGTECPECWKGLVTGVGNATLTGAGRGVLAVQGDVAFAPGSSWTGLVVASGNVEVQQSATVTGLVRGGGRVALADGAVVDGSACAALRALESAGSLARPFPVSGSSWGAAFAPGGP